MQPPQTPGQRITRLRGSDGFARERTGDSGGRGGFSERSPSPPRPLSPEERMALEVVVSAELVPPERWGRSPIGLGVVTAADRAAATVRGVFLIYCKCVFSGIDFRSLWTYNNGAEGFCWLALAAITAHVVVTIVSGCFFFKGFERVEQRSCCEQHAKRDGQQIRHGPHLLPSPVR